jgi:hypothetical protein
VCTQSRFDPLATVLDPVPLPINSLHVYYIQIEVVSLGHELSEEADEITTKPLPSLSVKKLLLIEKGI